MRKLLALAALITTCAIAQTPEGTPFSRIYKKGEKLSYAAKHHMKFIGVNQITFDIDLTTTKLLDKGRADLLVHWSNLHSSETNDTTVLPGDFSIQAGPNSLVQGFKPEQGNIGVFILFLQLADATADKPVKVGDEVPVVWDGGDGSLSFKGTMKVVEILPDKKRIKTFVKVIPSFGGQATGDITFNSTCDLTDGSLIETNGAISLDGKSMQDFSFVRKDLNTKGG